MNIFLGGSHRVGKSSVAEKLADLMGWAYIPTHLSSMKMWQFIGSPSDNYTFAERVRIQEELLKYFVKVIDNAALTNNVFDRSLTDLIGYLNTSYDSTSSALFDDYICNDFLATIKKYDNVSNHTFILQPNINYKYCLDDAAKNNKVYNSYAYRHALTDAIVGFAVRHLHPNQYTLVPNGLDIDEIVEFIIGKLS